MSEDALTTARGALSDAEESAPKTTKHADQIALAQAHATLALAEATAEQNDVLAEFLGGIERRLDTLITATRGDRR